MTNSNVYFWGIYRQPEHLLVAENPFPSLLAWFQFVKTPSHWICHFLGFWRIENAGNNAKKLLKTPFHRKKCTKTPQNSLKTMPKAWKRGPQVCLPCITTLQRLCVNFTNYYANWGEIDKKLKRLISLFDKMRAKGVLTNWCWYGGAKVLHKGSITGMMAEMIFFSLGMCTTSWFYILFEIHKFGVRLVFFVTFFDSEKFVESVTWAAELSSDCVAEIWNSR